MDKNNPRVSAEEFARMFESVKTWGQWGTDDQRGCLNYISGQQVQDAAALVRTTAAVLLKRYYSVTIVASSFKQTCNNQSFIN